MGNIKTHGTQGRISIQRWKSHSESLRSAKVIPLFPHQENEKSSEEVSDSDAQLLTRITHQDINAFETLVHRHHQRFYRVACRFSAFRNEAEDIVQDAFLKLWERPEIWQEGRNAAFTTWFYRIVVNLCLDYAKKKRPQQLTDNGWIEDERDGQEQIYLENERQRLLEEQIALLPDRQRMALMLCFYEGLSNQEAADAMQLHVKALQALLMRAKTTMKERLRFMIGD